MNKKIVVVVFFLLASVFITSCKKDVESGEIVKCKRCSKEISSNVRVLHIYSWEADKYSVKTTSTYCEKCGSENVQYKISTKCTRCGKVYNSRVLTAQRREEPRDKSVAEGFCSDSCRRATKVDEKIDKVSERTGDLLGRAARGLYDGIKKHAP